MSSELLDRQHIVDVVTSVGRCLDERDFEALRDLFTDDATIATPGGTVSGHEALVAQARRGHSRDKGIQHVITNHLVDIDGDRASVRANLLVAFAASGPDDPQPFLLGEVYRLELRRSADGWRISSLSSTPVWSLNRSTRLAGLPSPA